MYQIEFQLADQRLSGLASFSSERPIENKAQLSAVLTQKPVMVMLHGWQDNAASFAPLFGKLSERFHIIAIDWPGHGLSTSRSADNFYHFVDYVDDLAQLVALLDQPQVTLVGHSMGALVAVCFAAAFGDKVDSLMLIEGLAPLSETAESTPDRLRQGIVSRQRYRARAQQRQNRSMDSFQQALDLRCAVNGLMPEQIKPVVARAVLQRDGRWYWRHDNRLRCDSLYRMAHEQSRALVASVQCPVLSIIGETGYRKLKREQPDAQGWQQLEQIEVAGGHHCHLQSPERVADEILLFNSNFNALV
ncbi:alpha/beta fold hydrolase [Photobacterium lutimaris]|uniref:Alpha/beta hydrolase n=1 Tax=Photobacterium lutimaris TaxID=388278 RepID=A0A2T3IVN9_9GAMM|nr:alpha/beta hydrolase [Photobacterium lutimaris]PSU32470.1 alpha/beta hydrolase [Photobacterium lutimaris]TDR77678.1 pimeloyl-ACP methyl ester carboxylesterase [Photobacterium lutimaris]